MPPSFSARPLRRRRLLLLLSRAAICLCSGGGLVIFIILLSWYNDRQSQADTRTHSNSIFKYLPVIGLAISASWNLIALILHGAQSAAWLSRRLGLYADVACAVELAVLGYAGFVYDVLSGWRTGGHVPFSEKRVEVIGVTLLSLSGAAHLVFFCYGCFDEPEAKHRPSRNETWATQLHAVKSVRSDDSACDADSLRRVKRETGDSSHTVAPLFPYPPPPPPPPAVHFEAAMVPAPLSLSHASAGGQPPFEPVPIPAYAPGYYYSAGLDDDDGGRDTFADEYPLPLHNRDRDSDSAFSTSTTSMLTPRPAPLPPGGLDRKPPQTPTLPPPISPLASPSVPPAIPPRTPRPLRVDTGSTPLIQPVSLRSRGDSSASTPSTVPSSLDTHSSSHRLFPSTQIRTQSPNQNQHLPVSPISSPATPPIPPRSRSRKRSRSHTNPTTIITTPPHSAARHARSVSSISRLAGMARKGANKSAVPSGKLTPTPIGGEREESEEGREVYLPGGYVTNLENLRSGIELAAFAGEGQGRAQNEAAPR